MRTESPPVDQDRLLGQLGELGVRPGEVLVVHTSFRAIGPVEGGSAGLIDALVVHLGPSGTLVMPSMTGSRRPKPYDPRQTRTKEMGAVAEAFWHMQGVRRSSHPTSSFAAHGPLADEICASQPLEPVHGLDSPMGRAYVRDAQILLLATGQDANTTIHLGEGLAEVPYRTRKWATISAPDGPRRVEFLETDHCCQRFALVDEWLSEEGALRTGAIGHGQARLMRARDVVRTVQDHLRGDALAFLHPDNAGCDECSTARRSIA